MFKDVSMKYREHLDYALRDLSIEIQGGEKIGVVGRTGAGKSTILQTIFRLVEVDKGIITIDGQDIRNIGLHDLRR